MTTGPARKAPVSRPGSWSEPAERPWSYWDLWFAAVALSDTATERRESGAPSYRV